MHSTLYHDDPKHRLVVPGPASYRVVLGISCWRRVKKLRRGIGRQKLSHTLAGICMEGVGGGYVKRGTHLFSIYLPPHPASSAHPDTPSGYSLSQLLPSPLSQPPTLNMSRFVRASKFRHMYGTAAKRDGCYDNLRISISAWDTNMVKANGVCSELSDRMGHASD
jgi:hypothetical protein